jgi:hypothetical protein
VRPDGRPFAWRGITAFQLLEMEANGRGGEADAYLKWAASERLTVVRVLAMAKHLFVLEPEKGLKALDALLARAARHGLFVEVVALADTQEYPVDIPAHVKRVGEICARHANALIEIANEPYHPTQRADVHAPAYLQKLRPLIPVEVPTALGTGPDIVNGGDYVTSHYPRDGREGDWGWVASLRAAREDLKRVAKPLVDDEPIGAGQKVQPGKRDIEPERFRAGAIAGRLLGIGSTFHYEGGLYARRPSGIELACFRAWQQAWTLVPGDAPVEPFDAGPSAPVRAIKGERAEAFLGRRGDTAWVLIAGAKADAAVDWGEGWTVTVRRTWPHSRFYAARRTLGSKR